MKDKDTFLLVSLEDDKAKKLANVISSETCRKILNILTEGNMTETEIAKRLNVPLSTVHYNLKQLVQGGLAKSSEFHYSSKGREVAHYSLVQKYIIIAPKSDEKLFSRLKGFLPAIAAVALSGFLIDMWQKSQQVVMPMADTSLRKVAEIAPMMANESAGYAANAFIQTANETIPTLPMAAPEPIVIVAQQSVLPWFFAGAALALLTYLLVETVLYMRKKI